MSSTKRSVTLHEFILSSTESEGSKVRQVVRVDINFQEGGMNYATYEVQKRGLYLSVSPLKITETGVMQCTEYLGFSGNNMLIKELKRFSRKQLDECAPDVETIQAVLDIVCDRNGIARQDAKAIYNQPAALAA